MEIAWALGWCICLPACLGLAWLGTRWIDEPAIRMSKRIAKWVLGPVSKTETETKRETFSAGRKTLDSPVKSWNDPAVMADEKIEGAPTQS
jgi:hypothetical protein